MAIDANKIGLKVKEVVYAMEDADRCQTMTKMKKELIGGDGNLQLFTYDLSKMVVGNGHLHVSNLRQRKSDRFFLPIV